jgi:hypothetical protein
MRVAFVRSVPTVLSLQALLLVAGINLVTAQEPKPAVPENQTTSEPSPSLDINEIKTLDQLRQAGTTTRWWYEVNLANASATKFIASSDELGSFDTLSIATWPTDRRPAIMKKIEETKAELKSGGDRAVVEPKLRAAFAEYFIADMQYRVRELDEIKAKVAETESKLQKRLDNQHSSVDLQVKILLQEADGLGFFPASATANASSSTSDFKTAPLPTAPRVAQAMLPNLTQESVAAARTNKRMQDIEAVVQQREKALADSQVELSRLKMDLMESKRQLESELQERAK